MASDTRCARWVAVVAVDVDVAVSHLLVSFFFVTILPRVPAPPHQPRTLRPVRVSPQVLHREMVVELEDGNGSSVTTLGNPIKLSRNPRGADSFPPALGEHTTDILRSVLGKSSSDIDDLLASGIVVAPRQEVAVD